MIWFRISFIIFCLPNTDNYNTHFFKSQVIILKKVDIVFL